MLTLADLEADLRSEDTDSVLDAAWKTFDVVARLADAATGDERSDHGLALLVGMHCDEGRAQLPLPQTPGHLQTPDLMDDTAIEPYTGLLRQVAEAFLRLAEKPGHEAYAGRLTSTAEQAELCAGLLPGLREGEGAPT